MFLRKLFNSENKFTWVIIDLIIVIIGVYCAFLIQNFEATKKVARERDKIYSALKYELEIFRYTSTQIYAGQTQALAQWKKVRSNGSYIDFSSWRFIEPQYRYQIIEYALKIEDSDIVDFDLYNSLQQLFTEIKKVEHTERIITETASGYRYFPEGISESSEAYKLVESENKRRFDRFIQISADRVNTMELVRDGTIDVLSILNNRLDPAKKKSIEEELIRLGMVDFPSIEKAILITKNFFPDWPEEELKKIHEEIHNPKKN